MKMKQQQQTHGETSGKKYLQNDTHCTNTIIIEVAAHLSENCSCL